MLGVGLRKLVHWTALAMLSERRKLYEHRPPEGAKPARGGVQNGLREASGRLFFASWDRLGRQGRSEAVLGWLWGRSWDACHSSSRLGGLLGRPGPLLGASWGSFGDLPRVDLDDLDVVCGVT